jgi:two-component system, NarL family, response regulator DevR
MTYTRPRAAVVLDPHPLCHEGLRSLLAPLNVHVTGAACSPEDALALVTEQHPDLFLAGIDVPDGPREAIRCVREARAQDPGLVVLVISERNDEHLVEAALAAGAAAYVDKTADPGEIAAHVRTALWPSIYLVGDTALSPVASTGLHGARGTVPVATAAGDVTRLTRRELDVLRLVEGRSNREVARLLWVTDETVKFHLANVYRKLGVSSRAEAVSWARAHGLLDVLADGTQGTVTVAGARAAS